MNNYLSEEIVEATLYNQRHVILHGYVLPFLVLYPGWMYLWTVHLGIEEYTEAGFIGLAVVGLVQVLSCLFCHWFVQVKCFATCSRVTGQRVI